MVTECQEIAATMPKFNNFDDALRFVKLNMPNESWQVTQNVAHELTLLLQEGVAK